MPSYLVHTRNTTPLSRDPSTPPVQLPPPDQSTRHMPRSRPVRTDSTVNGGYRVGLRVRRRGHLTRT
ncbi:hypothetical protein [Brevibacillus laterosporus]|uniref:Uncharacterized protein n=1 Tax=Brevibacillus laterosporus TaxID=1465 RepID=A0AAP3DLG2_BRELA|nr:hypothetical protein [Brevibacillus laterosporus]MCR8983092.1 hypothetical protein [Brevibacillus laterosporus]MCZ0810248.1 hypothetical protein [Brevibacillus laterosporus]MCZ0828897.1 hypothetical protein [Brevibacillus laterosporus]MCZ0852952.1 hypothetical protein [Brevibacillus laterosporus]